MVVGNSLLINAVRSELDIATNLFLSLAGLFLCILWGIMTWDGWNWFYKSMADAKKLPVDPLLNPFSSMPNLADRHSDTIFKCTMAMIVIFGLVYVADLLGRRRTRISASSWRRDLKQSHSMRMKRRPIAIMWRSCSDSLLTARQMD